MLKIYNLTVDFNISAQITDKLAKGEIVDTAVFTAIEKSVNRELKLKTDVQAKIGSGSKVFMETHNFSGHVDAVMNKAMDRLIQRIETSTEIKNKPEVLANIEKLRQKLITSEQTAVTGRQLHLIKEGQFRKELGREDSLSADIADNLRVELTADISNGTSMESFIKARPEILKEAGTAKVEDILKNANAKTEGLSIAEALVRVDTTIRKLMNPDKTQAQRSLNADQIEAVTAFLEGKSIEQMAGAGKTEVCLTYMSIMSLVYGKKFNGLIITDSALASGKYVERNFAGTEGLSNQELLKSFGKKIVDGSELFRKRDYAGLEKALKDSDTILVIDYTSFGHMHNLYYEAPKLVAEMEKINVRLVKKRNEDE